MTSTTRNMERNGLLQRLKDGHSKLQSYSLWTLILFLTLTFSRSVKDNMKKIADEYKHIFFAGK